MLRKIFLFIPKVIGITFSLFTFSLNAQEKKQPVNYIKEGYVKAAVINYKVDGCGFLIQLADKAKTKLVPDKMPDDFKKDKKKVWVKYSISRKQEMSSCMAGKQCEVVDIKKRK